MAQGAANGSKRGLAANDAGDRIVDSAAGNHPSRFVASFLPPRKTFGENRSAYCWHEANIAPMSAIVIEPDFQDFAPTAGLSALLPTCLAKVNVRLASKARAHGVR
jgi:hypothetical protein